MRLRLKHKSNLEDLEFYIDEITLINESSFKEYVIYAQLWWSQDALDKLKALDYKYHFLGRDGLRIKEGDEKAVERSIVFYVPINRLIQITS